MSFIVYNDIIALFFNSFINYKLPKAYFSTL